MSEAIVTKQHIAEGFKLVMKRKSFEKITITDITDQCGLNRQTFYYHFKDKYDLLKWILYTDVTTPFMEDLTIDNWHENLLQILLVLKQDARFYANAFNTPHGDEFRQYLFNTITDLLSDIIDRLSDRQPLPPDDKQFIAEFLAYGVAGSVTKWVKTGMKRSPQETVRYIQEIVDGFKQFVASRVIDTLFPEP